MPTANPQPDLAALRAAASPRPWVQLDEPEFAGVFSGENGPHIADFPRHADAALVVALVNEGEAENVRLRAEAEVAVLRERVAQRPVQSADIIDAQRQAIAELRERVTQQQAEITSLRERTDR